MKNLKLSKKFMYYSGVLASAFPEAFPEAVEDLVHIQGLIDAEEQGLLLRLPCKVGDRVYAPTRNFVSEYTIRSIEIFRNNIFFNWVCDEGIYKRIDGFPEFELGESVFLTKAEAEKKLAEMGE